MIPTLVFRQVLQIDQHGEVVARLGGYNVGAILALEDRLGAVLHQFAEAFDLQRDEDLGLALGGGDVEGDAVEIGDDLVNVGGSSSVRGQSGGPRCGRRRGGAHPEKRSLSRDSMSTFW